MRVRTSTDCSAGSGDVAIQRWGCCACPGQRPHRLERHPGTLSQRLQADHSLGGRQPTIERRSWAADFPRQVSKKRQEFAQTFGAHHFIDPTQADVVATVKLLTGGQGVSHIVCSFFRMLMSPRSMCVSTQLVYKSALTPDFKQSKHEVLS